MRKVCDIHFARVIKGLFFTIALAHLFGCQKFQKQNSQSSYKGLKKLPILKAKNVIQPQQQQFSKQSSNNIPTSAYSVENQSQKNWRAVLFAEFKQKYQPLYACPSVKVPTNRYGSQKLMLSITIEHDGLISKTSLLGGKRCPQQVLRCLKDYLQHFHRWRFSTNMHRPPISFTEEYDC